MTAPFGIANHRESYTPRGVLLAITIAEDADVISARVATDLRDDVRWSIERDELAELARIMAHLMDP